jgi:mannose-1-phosphate guanylyltransferase
MPGRIVTFAVAPERAATKYGNIAPGEVMSGKVRAVKQFVENPIPPRPPNTSRWPKLAATSVP